MAPQTAQGADFFKTDSCKIGAETIGAAVSNTGMPVELDSGVKMVGMGHKLSPQEANAGVSVFGGGSIFNPKQVVICQEHKLVLLMQQVW